MNAEGNPGAQVIRFSSPRPVPASRLQSPAAWPVPPWVTAPVVAIAIPHSALAWGSNLSADTAEVEPATIGFAEPEPVAQQDVAAEGAAADAPAPPAAFVPPPIEANAAASQPAAAEPAADGAHPAETLAQALLRGIGDGATARAAESQAADRPLPRSAGEARPGARQLRAERPLGAPHTALPRPAMPGPALRSISAPGLPAANPPPIMIEPQVDPGAATETAVATRPPDRPAIRNRRLYRRVTIDAGFEIDGTAVQLLDLSMGGFAAANAAALAPDMTVPVKLQLSIDGVDISAAMRASMVYCAEPRSGGRFIDLTASQTALLRYIVTWRGQAVGALGTATLLDAISRWPEQAAPSAPALPPVPPERRQSWWSRALGWLRPRGRLDQ